MLNLNTTSGKTFSILYAMYMADVKINYIFMHYKNIFISLKLTLDICLFCLRNFRRHIVLTASTIMHEILDEIAYHVHCWTAPRFSENKSMRVEERKLY